jgi:hypothetical protein
MKIAVMALAALIELCFSDRESPLAVEMLPFRLMGVLVPVQVLGRLGHVIELGH